MSHSRRLTGVTVVAAVCALLLASAARAQQSSSGGLLGNLFDRAQPPAQQQVAQADNGVDARIDRIENALRQLTGAVEQLQHQAQQMQMELQHLQGGGANGGYPYLPSNTKHGAVPTTPPAASTAAAPFGTPRDTFNSVPPPNAPNMPRSLASEAAGPDEPPSPAAPSAGEGDAFNPALHPNAPGVPRSLASEVPGSMPAAESAAAPTYAPPVGLPSGRSPGQPLDLSSLGGSETGAVAPQNGPLPPPPPSNPSGTGVHLATLPPSSSPKDEYELAYGYVLHKNYALAAQALRDFLRKYPDERQAADAQYWLGESLFQQQHYRDAAESFLKVSTKYKHASKAPDALLRLGQSLAALHQKDAACATLAEVRRKYPQASTSVKRGVARELKRVHC